MKQTVAWFNILWKLQKHIHCLPVFTWHWYPARCPSLANINMYQLHSGSSVKASSRTVHAAMAGFVERAGRSADVVNQGLWTVFVYTIMSKVALQYPHEELLMAPVQTTEPWCMVGAYKESTCTGECVFMVRSLRLDPVITKSLELGRQQQGGWLLSLQRKEISASESSSKSNL